MSDMSELEAVPGDLLPGRVLGNNCRGREAGGGEGEGGVCVTTPSVRLALCAPAWTLPGVRGTWRGGGVTQRGPHY